MSGKANESAVKKGLLFRPASRAEIMRAGAEHAEVTVEQVVRELKLIGFSDIRKVVSWRNELVTRTEKGEDGEPVNLRIKRVWRGERLAICAGSPRHRGSAGDDRGAMIYPRLPNTFCCALALMGLNYRGLGSSSSDHQLV